MAASEVGVKLGVDDGNPDVLTVQQVLVIEVYCARCRVSRTHRTRGTDCVIDGRQQGGPRKGIIT